MRPRQPKERVFLGDFIERIVASFFTKPPLRLHVVRDAARLSTDDKTVFECPLDVLGSESVTRLQFEIPAFLTCLLLDILLSSPDGLRPDFDADLVFAIVMQGLTDAATAAGQPKNTSDRLFARYGLHIQSDEASVIPELPPGASTFAAHLVASDSRYKGLPSAQREARFAAALKIGVALQAFAEINIRPVVRGFYITPIRNERRA